MKHLKTTLLGVACGACFFATVAGAEDFNIPAGDLKSALTTYAKQTGIPLIVSGEAVKGVSTQGVKGSLSADAALTRILAGTGFMVRRHNDAGITIIPETRSSDLPPMQLAQSSPPPRASVETVTVTSSKLGGADVQSIPIAITALSQEQLTATQTAGGPDLVKQVPNLTFTKTNFSGYSINIRGIGTQAISVTTDPAVAVSLNDMPFIRNHFFEQEFFDVGQLEVLRGPQGTLYGRNATAGVVNITTAKPSDQFEAMASGELGNYHQRRFEGMINLPIVDDRLDIRLAGEWTKRQGYSFNALTDQRIDGRDLWSGRATIGWKPFEKLQTYLIWEHFSENDDRMRSAKQLCKRDEGPSEVNGVSIPGYGPQHGLADGLSQGCLPASPYAEESFGTPNGQSLSFLSGLQLLNIMNDHDPYLSTAQSQNLRVIESSVEPSYKARNDIVELNADYAVTPELTFTSQTGFSHDFLYSTEDYNRFNTAPGVFNYFGPAQPYPNPDPFSQILFPSRGQISTDGVFCDPQLGCSDRLVGADLDVLHSWQLSQEFRVSSKFSGPLNFSFGGNYLHYEIDESYYVFINALTILSSIVQGQNLPAWASGNIDNHECLGGLYYADPAEGVLGPFQCGYIDPNPISSLDGNGHNYFRSHNPYVLNSYAGFGEAYYDVTPDLKFIGGVRWTDDQKHFPMIPSFLLVRGWGSYVEQTVDQEWSEVTGRAAVNWTPKLDFTDQTLVYGSFAHGYKAGGANPPGATLLKNSSTDYGAARPTHPLTFAPEFINAYELGSKNTLLDGALTLNGDLFYYDYKGYQISQIIDRTSININVDARVKGAELEAAYEPIPGLRFNFAGGWEHSEINDGQSAIDLMDRTAGHSDWLVLKPTITRASNCIIPSYVVSEAVAAGRQDAVFYNAGATGQTSGIGTIISACQTAYDAGLDPLTNLIYTAAPNVGTGAPFIPPPGYAGFDPLAGTPGDPYHGQNTQDGHDYGPAPNNGEGFAKDLGGNALPNTPPFTISAGTQYTMPISNDWAATLRADYYWQDYSWARIFNDNPYDRLRGYTNVNLTLILTSQNGWQVMLYDKNVFNTTDITGTFLNSDDSGLTTNVFTTDPRLIGVRVTKNW
jgi:outer membrane receptor protein involved in Fe transport